MQNNEIAKIATIISERKSTLVFRELGIVCLHHRGQEKLLERIYLLHLELDGGLEVQGLVLQVVVVGDKGGELASL